MARLLLLGGKGGVGKSTFSVNLSVALKSIGMKVGLLDADIYGPSIPRMMGVSKKPEMNENKKLIPIENFDIKCMSIGFILDNESPTIWRGPMVMKALEQMFNGVEWGSLDYLIIDLPPGTGDAQLTLAQSSKLSGSIINLGMKRYPSLSNFSLSVITSTSDQLPIQLYFF